MSATPSGLGLPSHRRRLVRRPERRLPPGQVICLAGWPSTETAKGPLPARLPGVQSPKARPSRPVAAPAKGEPATLGGGGRWRPGAEGQAVVTYGRAGDRGILFREAVQCPPAASDAALTATSAPRLRHPARSTGLVLAQHPVVLIISVCCVSRLHGHWIGLTPGSRSQPNRRWDQLGTTVGVRPHAAQPIDDGRQGRHGGRPFPPPSCNSTTAPGRAAASTRCTSWSAVPPGMPVGRVHTPQHGAVPKLLGRRQYGRGDGPAWWPEAHRAEVQRLQGAPASGDLIPDAGHRQPVKGRGVAPGVAAQCYPGGQLPADQLGVALDLAANGEGGGWRPSLDEDGQDQLGGLWPGAVVEVSATASGPGFPRAGWKATGTTRPDSSRGPRRPEPDPLEAIASGCRPAARKLLDCPGHGLDPAPGAGHRDSVATVQASGLLAPAGR
jgi:hypothetical protein